MDVGKGVACCVGVVCVTILGVAYFVFVRQDGTVLTALTGAIGFLVGYMFPKKAKAKKKK